MNKEKYYFFVHRGVRSSILKLLEINNVPFRVVESKKINEDDDIITICSALHDGHSVILVGCFIDPGFSFEGLGSIKQLPTENLLGVLYLMIFGDTPRRDDNILRVVNAPP